MATTNWTSHTCCSGRKWTSLRSVHLLASSHIWRLEHWTHCSHIGPKGPMCSHTRWPMCSLREHRPHVAHIGAWSVVAINLAISSHFDLKIEFSSGEYQSSLIHFIKKFLLLSEVFIAKAQKPVLPTLIFPEMAHNENFSHQFSDVGGKFQLAMKFSEVGNQISVGRENN